jgi:hypothetical protein
MPQVAGLVGVGIAALYFFQEKVLYVPVMPGVPADYWIKASDYGLEEQVGMHACMGASMPGFLGAWHANGCMCACMRTPVHGQPDAHAIGRTHARDAQQHASSLPDAWQVERKLAARHVWTSVEGHPA